MKTLKAYAGDEASALIELTESLIIENETDLNKLKKGITEKDSEICRDAIHRLTSRFGQVEVKEEVDMELIRIKLYDVEADFPEEELESLYHFWKSINQQIQKDLGLMSS